MTERVRQRRIKSEMNVVDKLRSKINIYASIVFGRLNMFRSYDLEQKTVCAEEKQKNVKNSVRAERQSNSHFLRINKKDYDEEAKSIKNLYSKALCVDVVMLVIDNTCYTC